MRVLANANFRYLWFGQFISQFGDSALNITLPFYVYHLTGSPSATALMFTARALPLLLVGPVAGVFVDRWNLRATMWVTDVLRALVLLPALFVDGPDLLWVLWISAFLEAALGRFFNPARQAIIPVLVGNDALVNANSFSSTTESLLQVLGPTIGGGMAVWLGFRSVIFLDALSYLVSALCILAIRMPGSDQEAPARKRRTFEGVFTDLREGIRAIRDSRPVVLLFLSAMVFMVSQGFLNAVLVVFVKDVLGGDQATLGYLEAAQGLGMIASGMLIGWLGSVVRPSQLFAWGLMGAGASLTAVFQAPSLFLVLCLIFVAGLFTTAQMVGMRTLMQTLVPPAVRGRVFASLSSAMALVAILASLGAGVLASRIPVRLLLTGAGLAVFTAGFAALAITRFEARPTAEGKHNATS